MGGDGLQDDRLGGKVGLAHEIAKTLGLSCHEALAYLDLMAGLVGHLPD